ncbi:hypothetical protein N9N67_09550 [Bacteriovoracaceae bacterium]|nr:hypothetical protein [Bacteriovoracaceae bacterium]
MKIEQIIQGLKDKDYSVLAKAITLIESKLKEEQVKAQKLLKQISKDQLISSPTVTIGISGPPGVGKSSFIEKFGTDLLEHDTKLCMAVLTIDPSSNKVGGSILGDKTRMDKLTKNQRAFIRPSPSSPYTGGLHKNTFDVIQLCRFFSFDYIFLESVGVGQVEVEIEHFVDYVWLLMQPGSGDELQSIKKGILEIAEVFVLNKFDGQFENKVIELEKDLSLSFGQMKDLFKFSAFKDGMSEKLIHYLLEKKNGDFQSRVELRKKNMLNIFNSYVSYLLLDEFLHGEKTAKLRQKVITDLRSHPDQFWLEANQFKKKLLT